MNRSDFILVTMTLQGPDILLSPVQAQKLFFILDREAPLLFDGPYFDFKPYDYGPFDVAVYSELENLNRNGLAKVEESYPYRIYGLTDSGYKTGLKLAKTFSDEASKYIKDAGSFVQRLSFQQLVTAIYKKYPDMRSKSVFRE